MTTEQTTEQTTTQQPIGYTWKCPCGRSSTTPFSELYFVKKAIKNHKLHNHGQTGCRRLKLEVIPIMPSVV